MKCIFQKDFIQRLQKVLALLGPSLIFIIHKKEKG
jgi:hypothetical protein